jgi:hypothetical protein
MELHTIGIDLCLPTIQRQWAGDLVVVQEVLL